MRAVWKGAIGFGLVNIPVKLYSATQSSTLDLDMIDKRDFGKIRYIFLKPKNNHETLKMYQRPQRSHYDIERMYP